VLLASDGDKLALLSAAGEIRSFSGTLACARSLLATPSAVFAAASPPCQAGLTRLAPDEASEQLVLKLAEAPLGLVAQADGSVVFGNALGLWRWSGGEQTTRVGAGLTPGPG
ncbi:MAG: hypothetical protein V1750_06275, partial [Acidobacteriota bacterium]